MHTNPVYDPQGRLTGYQITTYTPVPPARPQPTPQAHVCGCGCHKPDALAAFREEDWLPSDSPDWGSPAPGPLTAQASEDYDGPSDTPDWS